MSKDRKFRFSMSVYVYSILMIYVLISIIVNFTRKNIDTFEVPYATINKDKNEDAILVREETVVKSTGNNSLVLRPNYSKIVSGDYLYLQVPDSKKLKEISSKLRALSKLDDTKLGNIYSEYYKLITYDTEDIENLKDTNNTIQNIYLSNIDKESLEKVLHGYSSEVRRVKAEKSGIFTSSLDGYEKLEKKNLPKLLDDSSLSKSIQKSSDIGKIITSEKWSAIYEVGEEEFRDTTIYFDPLVDVKQEDKRAGQLPSQLNVVMDRDKKKLVGSVAKHVIDGKFFIELKFEDGLIRYINQRKTKITLSKPKIEGFRIPKSSVIEKNGEKGVLVLNSGIAIFKKLGLVEEDNEFNDFFITFDGTDKNGKFITSNLRVNDIIAIDGKSIKEGEERY